MVLNNIQLTNVSTAVGVVGGDVVLPGGAQVTIDTWVQGNIFAGNNSTGIFTQGNILGPSIPSSLLNSAGQIFGKTHPQYEHYNVSQFVSVRDCGATGDGTSDDTDAIQAVLDKVSNCFIHWEVTHSIQKVCRF